ncbi:MAG: hypothetical protein IJF76_00275 [Clostridia bacterium]|nr:hypothetical protein [Clostridia bacterium]
MDLKISKKRISEHLSYDWTKYLIIIIVCSLVMSLFYMVTARRLTDLEELKIVVYGQYVGKFESTYKDYLDDATSEFDSSYIDTVVEYYATKDDLYSQQAASIKTDASFTMGVDVFVLPTLKGLIDDNGKKLKSGSFFVCDEQGKASYMKEDAALTFNYRIGRNYFISIEELLLENKENPEVVKLKGFFENYPEYFYKSERVVAWDEDPNNLYDYVHIDDGIKSYGINLGKLNLSKTTELVNDELNVKECNYVLGVVRGSMSHLEAVCFLNWFIETYAE